MTTNGELTARKSCERWVVVVDKNQFVLDGNELQVLRNANQAGNRGMVWFRDFAISIPHISCIYLESRKADESNMLPQPSARLTNDDKEKWLKHRETLMMPI